MSQHSFHAIALVDLDAFYTQVEALRNPDLRNVPLAVVQYNPFGDLASHTADECRIANDSNGSLIAVSYPARAHGVKRYAQPTPYHIPALLTSNMRGDEARRLCPALQLVQVPTAHGKADLTLYRAEGAKVLAIMARYGVTERASIDEMYIDCTTEAVRRLQANGGAPTVPAALHQIHIAALVRCVDDVCVRQDHASRTPRSSPVFMAGLCALQPSGRTGNGSLLPPSG